MVHVSYATLTLILALTKNPVKHQNVNSDRRSCMMGPVSSANSTLFWIQKTKLGVFWRIVKKGNLKTKKENVLIVRLIKVHRQTAKVVCLETVNQTRD